MNILKGIILFASIVLCGVQLKTAFENLFNPPTVDSTRQVHLKEVDLPLITVCPIDQLNKEMLKELGYMVEESLMMGNTYTKCDGNPCISWGAHKNLTFHEILEMVYTNHNLETQSHDYIPSPINNSVYLPGFGLCSEISHFDPVEKLIIVRNDPSQALRILITDRQYRSYVMPHISSHKGNNILVEPGKSSFITVDIEIRSTCKTEADTETPLDFKKCVDDRIQKKFGKELGCVPPWLSPNNQCNKTYPGNAFTNDEFFSQFVEEYITPLRNRDNILDEALCRKSCTRTKYIVHERESIKQSVEMIEISFNQNVLITETVYNYGLFQFVVDAGSSLGLWLGLSVLGLHDLALETFHFLKNIEFCKKIKSSLSKEKERRT